MGSFVKVTRNDMPLMKRAVVTFMKNEAPRIAAGIIIPNILQRTAKGRNADGVPFIPYSKEYAKYGRKNLGYSVKPPNLQREGLMLGSIRYYPRLTIEQGTGPAIALSVAENSKGVGNQRYRVFIAVGSTDISHVQRGIIGTFNNLSLSGS